MIRLFLLSLSLCPICLLSQAPPIQIELGAGVGAGWWVYNKGFTDTLPTIHRGYDRTHLSMLWPSELSISYARNNWEWGIALGQRTLADDQMIGSDHRRGRFRKYTISVDSKNNIPIQHISLFGRGYLIKKRKFWMGASASLGTFYMTHNHPRKSTFQLHIAQEVGIIHLIWLSPHLAFTVHPQFSNYRITSEGQFEGERHNIYGLTGRLGLKISLAPYSSSP